MGRSSIEFSSNHICEGYQQTWAIVIVHDAAEEDDRMKNGKQYDKAGLLHAAIALTMVTSCQVDMVEHLRSHERVFLLAAAQRKGHLRGRC